MCWWPAATCRLPRRSCRPSDTIPSTTGGPLHYSAGWPSCRARRWSLTATTLPTGRVLVSGGYNADSGYLAEAELYDLTTGAWASAGHPAAPDLDPTFGTEGLYLRGDPGASDTIAVSYSTRQVL